MSRARLRAFTLVELLVVIAIIGTLVGLLLPAIQRSREASRRSTCLSNIRQLALSATHFENRMRRFPPLFDSTPVQLRQSESNERWTTWAVIMLPDLEQESAYTEYARGNVPRPEAYIETYLCPSDSVKTRSGNVCSYVANAGEGVSASDQTPVNGAFLNRIYDSKAAVADGHWKDGKDHTIVFSERSECQDYDLIGWDGMVAQPNQETVDPVNRKHVDEKKEDRTWNPAFVWRRDPLPCTYINGPFCVCEEPDVPPCIPIPDVERYVAGTCTLECHETQRSPNARPSSEHGGGVNMAFGSGRARFVRDSIDYELYCLLMTLNDDRSSVRRSDKHYDDSSLD